MRKRIWACATLMSLIVLSSCIEHKKEEKTDNTTTDNKEERKFIAEKDYKTLRIYAGKIPCADCSGIDQRLVLKGDTMGVYRLTEIYRDATEDGDATIVSTGEWKVLKSSKQKKIMLSQGHLGDSIRVSTYDFSDKKVVQNNMDGEPIKTTWNYTLKRVSSK